MGKETEVQGKETEVQGNGVRLVSLSQQLTGHRLYKFEASTQSVGFRDSC